VSDQELGKLKLLRWEDVPRERMTERIERRVISGERQTVAQVFLEKGAVVPEHSHESEQVSFVVKGALLFRIEGREILVRAGEVLRIPSWMPHAAEAVEDTYDLDMFSPRRQDWIDHTDDYFRRPEAR
jgi:quercetin dioxygenase-like cupin family protein